ncbi:hypothetical protein BGZ61DRAFT_541771 [Ilyonectria robusta]|uniref:uncharacterized protein n=1 Tax=Ilyonectria robusta TaxID=1079257 RepID=UPI001E8D4B56|nr:uncharacterized protein BGZ61DRAFT_541771 [Ilyonectria robusta]KAH8652913.1 hypothetical protein BGZ61DRAFT_541771 [Ilyonectria robusta]
MSYVTEATTWLPGVSQDVKTLIERFFELADTKQPDVGHVMATELFTRDAVITNPNGTHRGSAEISKSREHAWIVATSRKHTVTKVFSNNGEPRELVLLGSVRTGLMNGTSIASPFANHIKTQRPDYASGQPRISYMEVYADTASIARALAN